MTNYQTIRYLDTNGKLLGYRADTLGSLQLDWGKTYKDATKIFERLKQSKLQYDHKQFAEAILGVNRKVSAILDNDTSGDRYGDAKTIQLLNLTGFDGYNYNVYNSDEFARLVATATVADSFDLK